MLFFRQDSSNFWLNADWKYYIRTGKYVWYYYIQLSILLQLRPSGHEDSSWLFLSPMGVQLAEEKKYDTVEKSTHPTVGRPLLGEWNVKPQHWKHCLLGQLLWSSLCLSDVFGPSWADNKRAAFCICRYRLSDIQYIVCSDTVYKLLVIFDKLGVIL